MWLRGHAATAAQIVLVALIALFAVGCKETPAKPLSPSLLTSAELRMIRKGVTVAPRGEAEREPYSRERLGDGATVRIAESGLAWVRRDGGTTMLVHGPGTITLEEGTLRVDGGKMFAETPAGRTETILVPEGPLVLSAVRASLEVSSGSTDAYVLEGEIRAGAVVARAGERLHLTKGKPTVEPAVSWEDWTGGLATTDPSSEPAPYGVGTVGARKPGSAGTPYAALAIQRLDVRVRVEGDLAITEVDQTFFNPESETVEGVYRFRVPEGALLERFGVDRDGGILYGFVKEKAQAQAQYQAHVYKGSTEDPALLAWQAPGVYEARLYPIGPGATRRVVVRYTEWLAREGSKAERRLYTYPMAFDGTEASAPQIEDLSIEVDLSKAGANQVRSAAAAMRVGDVIVVRDHDVIPRADFALELYDDGADTAQAVRAPHKPDLVALGPQEAGDARRKGEGEADYLLVPVRPTDAPKREEGLDLVVVVDTSAATDRAMLRLARATTRALVAHLGAKDRVLVLAGDDRLRAVGKSGELVKVDEAVKAELLEALATVEPGGASDLAAMLADATTKVGDQRASAIVYVGDGLSTVGETDLAAIRARLKKAPRLVRTFGLGIGDAANMATLSGLSSGGFAERVTDDRSAARAALRLLETAERSVDLGATLDLGSNVERVYPRELGAVVGGQTVMVVGRVTGESPKEGKLTTVRGSSTIKLAVTEMKDLGDLRRRWAVGRLDELLSEAAGHAALVDLGVRQGIITPVTSIYVPTSTEMTPEQRASIDRTTRKRTKIVKEKREPNAPMAQHQLAKSDVESVNENEKQKEGGTGTRAKGEEGAMGERSARGNMWGDELGDASADKRVSRRFAGSTGVKEEALKDAPDEAPASAPAPAATAAASAAPTAPWGRDDSLGDPAKPAEPRPPPAPTAATPPVIAEPTPERKAMAEAKVDRPVDGKVAASAAENAQGRETDKGTASGMGGGSAPSSGTVTPDSSERADEKNKNGDGDDSAYSGPGHDDVTIRRNRLGNVIVIVDDPGRIVRRCGRGADLPFEERKNLWRERLSSTNAQPSAILRVYKNALAWCEAPTMRERRALLILAFDYLPSVQGRVALYRLLTKDVQAADVVYRGILARVTTPAQVRELNQALGLVTVDPGTLEKTIKEAKDPADLASKLRLLKTKFPSDLTLALRLLDALEDAGDGAGARLLAKELRQRSDADARVRTSVGELHLRLAARASGAQKQADEDEAKRAFGEIVEFSPDDPVARRRLGDLYRAHGYFAEAARQYETLSRLVPDDPTAMVLMAASANGLGKLEESVRWLEKGGQAGAPDVSQGPHATARAFAALFIAWGRLDAKAASRTDEWKALGARLDKVVGAERREGTVRVLLSWSHPELHPALWTNAASTMMPAAEGDVTLGLSQGLVADRSGALVEVRVEPSELEHTSRLGAKAVLTVVFGEGKDAEVIDKREITFSKDAPVQRFRIASGSVETVAVEQPKPEAAK